MNISCHIVFYDGLDYSVDSNPGVAIAPLSKYWETTESSALSKLRTFAEHGACVSVSTDSTAEHLADLVWDGLGFTSERGEDARFAIARADALFFVEDESLTVGTLFDALGTGEYFAAFEFNNQAGEVLRGVDNGIRYCIHAREDMRHVPHVHVDFKHEDTASIGIEDGSVLDGKLRPKILNKARKTISQHKGELLDLWVKYTGFGLRGDVNTLLGVGHIR